MKTLKTLVVLGLLATVGGLGFLYSGFYNMGADDHHFRPVYWALETLRERSIAARSSSIKVPPLDEPNMLLAGGADYNEMCSGCHLKPGQKQSEISAGLYPQPPNLSMTATKHGHHHEGGSDDHGNAKGSAARQFWIIKHGVKASGMAAFGATHDDARIWAMVAFLQKLPTLDATKYQILTARGDEDMGGMEGMDHDQAAASGHANDDGAAAPATDVHADMAMPGMSMPTAAPASASAPEAALDDFQAALKAGDAAAAERWLAPDVLIYEGGGAERSRNEYAAHHLQADMAFLKTSQTERLKRSSGESGDAAWVTTETRVHGKSSKGRAIDVLSAETALLRKTPQGWRITHLHWSSQDYKTPTPTPTN